MCNIQTGSGTVTYKAVRKAMGNEPFTMSLTEPDEIQCRHRLSKSRDRRAS